MRLLTTHLLLFAAALTATLLSSCEPIVARSEAPEAEIDAAYEAVAEPFAEAAQAKPEAIEAESVAEESNANAEPAGEPLVTQAAVGCDNPDCPCGETCECGPTCECVSAVAAEHTPPRLIVGIHGSAGCVPCVVLNRKLDDGTFSVPLDVEVRHIDGPPPNGPEVFPTLRVFTGDGQTELRRMIHCETAGDWHWLLTGEYAGEVTADIVRFNFAASSNVTSTTPPRLSMPPPAPVRQLQPMRPMFRPFFGPRSCGPGGCR
jgi:hypothetical protein